MATPETFSLHSKRYGLAYSNAVVRTFLGSMGRALHILEDSRICHRQQLFLELVYRFRTNQIAWNRAKKAIKLLNMVDFGDRRAEYVFELPRLVAAFITLADPTLLRKLNKVFIQPQHLPARLLKQGPQVPEQEQGEALFT